MAQNLVLHMALILYMLTGVSTRRVGVLEGMAGGSAATEPRQAETLFGKLPLPCWTGRVTIGQIAAFCNS